MSRRLSARDIMETLVAFPTVSDVSNLALVDWVEDYLDGFGVTSHRVYDATGMKAALYANIGPEVEGGIVLSGHTDVVPVEGQDWKTDPFAVTEIGTRLYGRGTCDMKGFDALALATVPYALERGLRRPLQIALSYDEEVGCIGAPPMIADMARHLPKARAAIIGEPTMLRPVTGHKGTYGWSVHVRGHEVHSSLMHEGVSAILEAAKVLSWVNDMNAHLRAQTPTEVARDFLPPFSTVHTGTIHGGTAHNITAKDCNFDIDVRLVPGEDVATFEAALFAQVAEIEARMKDVHPDAGITMQRVFQVPALEPEQDGAAEQIIRRLTGDNGTHVVSFATEAGQFQEGGYSAVLCGPGDIAVAHQPNEYIEISQLNAGETLLRQIVDTLADAPQ